MKDMKRNPSKIHTSPPGVLVLTGSFLHWRRKLAYMHFQRILPVLTIEFTEAHPITLEVNSRCL